MAHDVVAVCMASAFSRLQQLWVWLICPRTSQTASTAAHQHCRMHRNRQREMGLRVMTCGILRLAVPLRRAPAHNGRARRLFTGQV